MGIRQIARQALGKRIVDDGADHAKLQLARLQPAMRLAGEAVADGDVKAIAPHMKVLDRVGRYQGVANVDPAYDDEAREKLLAKINRAAANLGVDEARAAAKATEAAKGGPARRSEGAAQAPERTPGRLKEIPGLGGRRKPLKRFDSDKEIKENPKAFLWRTASQPCSRRQNAALFRIHPEMQTLN